MFLTEANYYSSEANWAYLSSSQYKDFCGTTKQRGCEAYALAKLRGEWVEEPSEAMLVGSYVDAHFEGTLDLFRMQHPEVFKKNSDLKMVYVRAEGIIQLLERDEFFMETMSGEKQVILTAEMFGAMWKCKLDSYLRKKAIVDLKIIKNLRERFWVKDLGLFVSFVEWWGYDQQAAIYSKLESIISGEKMLPVYLAAADKKKVPDHEVIAFDENLKDLETILYDIERNVPRILQVKSGEVEPARCGICDYCIYTKKLTKTIYFRDLIER